MNKVEEKDYKVNTGASIIAGIIGIIVMTSFSYSSRVFKIPEMKEINMLNILISKNRKDHILAASFLHFLTGIIFSLSYSYLWSKNIGKPDTKNGIFLGLVSGIIGVSVWKNLINLVNRLPKFSLRHLSSNLIPAHILFSLTATKIYKLIHNK